MKTKKYVITGATSFLGRHIVEGLCGTNAEIYAIIRPTSNQRSIYEGNKQVVTVLSDMENTENWTQKIGTADYFLHLGWDGVGAEGRRNPLIQDKNVRNAVLCMEGAHKLECEAFLFAGSQAEYGLKDISITEDMQCNPISNYGKGKLQVLQKMMPLAEKYKMAYYHARIFSVYGSGDHPWALVPSCITKLCADQEIKLSSCTQYWNFMEAGDAACVLSELVKSRGASGVYNVASRDTRQLKEFVTEIYQLCGKRGKLTFGGYSPMERPANLRPNIDKIMSVIPDTSFVSFEKGIRRLILQQVEASDESTGI